MLQDVQADAGWAWLLASSVVLVSIVLLIWANWPKVLDDKRISSKAVLADGPTPTQIDQLFQSIGIEEQLHVEGSMIPSTGLCLANAEEPSPFSNELCTGKFLTLHRATHDKQLNRSGCYRYGEYFLGKKRIWETRIQFQFKVPPKTEDIYFGVEREHYVPMAGAARGALELMVRSLKAVVGDQVYHSVGDDPTSGKGSIERPVFVMPLWAYDQYIVTPEGEEPPQLTDPELPSMGSKRFQRVKEYRAELEALQFKAGPTYTFFFWGISRFIDKINWQISPLMSPVPFDCNLFCGSPPVQVVMYTLTASKNSDQRHLQERKRYYMNVAFWSSKCRPSWEKLDKLFGKRGANLEWWPSSGCPATWNIAKGTPRPLGLPRNSKVSKLSWFACCGAR